MAKLRDTDGEAMKRSIAALQASNAQMSSTCISVEAKMNTVAEERDFGEASLFFAEFISVEIIHVAMICM